MEQKFKEELAKRISAIQQESKEQPDWCNLPEVKLFNELAEEALKHDFIDRITAGKIASGIVYDLFPGVNVPRLTQAHGLFVFEQKNNWCGCLDSGNCVLEEGSALGEGVRCRKLHSGKPVILKGRYLGELGTFELGTFV